MAHNTDNSLILGDSNQTIASNGSHYNIEEYKRTFQMHCTSWASDKPVQIHIVKLFNTVTFHMSVIQGDLISVAGVPGTMSSVPWTLGIVPENYDPVSLDGRIPNRFLPRNTSRDVQIGSEGYYKSFPVTGINNGTGFTHLLTILHAPVGAPEFGDNGILNVGYNNSNSTFSHSDCGLNPTSISYLTNSNINIIS